MPNSNYTKDSNKSGRVNTASQLRSIGRSNRDWIGVGLIVVLLAAAGAVAFATPARAEPPTVDTIVVPVPDGGRFFDDDGNVHEISIEALATAGITKGCNPPYQTGYCLHQPVTREQMAAFLVRALGLTDNGGGNSFIDDDGSIFENDIAKLAAAGITKGCNPPENDLFCPKAAVTRGQMAAFLVRAMGYSATDRDRFVDDDDSIFEDDINKLASAGVTAGCNPPWNDNYCPDQPVTRAQMASFLTRALGLPTRAVPPRPETTNGTDLSVIAWAEMAGCSGESGETCTISADIDGESYLLTGWYAEGWSAIPTAGREEFRSSRVRVEATFDGVPIALVEWPFEVIDDTGLKTYSFQFPEWLRDKHILEVRFIDEFENYLWTVRQDIATSGTGYLQVSASSASASVAPVDPPSSNPHDSFVERRARPDNSENYGSGRFSSQHEYLFAE